MTASQGKVFDQDLINQRCDAHVRYLAGRSEGFLADFRDQTLSGLALKNRNLSDSLMSGAQLDGCDLSGSDFTDADLSGANLAGANMAGCIFLRTDLRGCDLSDANLIACDFTDADFRELAITPNLAFVAPEEGDAEDDASIIVRLQQLHAKVKTTVLDRANLSGSKLAYARLGAVSAKSAIFDDASLLNTRLNRSQISDARFCNAMIVGGDFSGADLSSADLRGCDRDSAKFEHAKTDGMLTGPMPDVAAEFKPATLLASRELEKRIRNHQKLCRSHGKEGKPVSFDGIDLRELEDLEGASLTAFHGVGANLSGMNLEGAELQGAVLRGADLRGTRLVNADLRGADLSGAHLNHADLRGARLDPLILGGNREFPVTLTNAIGRYIDCRDANLKDANLDGADFSYGRFGNTVLQGVDLDTTRMDNVFRD
ncbi:MAG: pentapeptide repeat-containing protein [Maricaulis sp.]|nr:pentapeptide repeat-containing protein [Maricaulis sp.]